MTHLGRTVRQKKYIPEDAKELIGNKTCVNTANRRESFTYTLYGGDRRIVRVQSINVLREK